MCSIITYLFFAIIFAIKNGSHAQLRTIMPVDSYQLLDSSGYRRLGSCNFTYVWLVPPSTSSMDAYGHALACTRLYLENGRVVQRSSDIVTSQNMKANDGKLNEKSIASLVDLNTLDALVRADQLGATKENTLQLGQLASDNRFFFLADRVGSLHLMAMLIPGQHIKLELLDPNSSNLQITPQHVLCFRKQCPDKKPNMTIISSTATAEAAAATAAESRTRKLYMQLIIAGVACAFIAFMCIVFAITSLVLCLRYRNHPGHQGPKRAAPSELSIYRETGPSPPYYQANGKISIDPTSPVYLTDASPRHLAYNTAASDTGSVNNALMTGSVCDGLSGMQNSSMTYGAIGQHYAHIPATAVYGTSCTNNTQSQLTYVPMNTRVSMISTPRGILLPCQQNGSASPVPSLHSITERKCGVVRTGSLGRYSQSSHPYYYPAEGRRKFVRLSKPNASMRMSESDSQSMGFYRKSTNGDVPMKFTDEPVLQMNDAEPYQTKDLISFIPASYSITGNPRLPGDQNNAAIDSKVNVNGDQLNTISTKKSSPNSVSNMITRKPAFTQC